MTGLLTGTNKFKNFEIETSQKISVLNSPYLEGRKYVYEDTNSSSVPSNYKIYDAAVWPTESVEIEDGFYALTKTGKEKSVANIYQIIKTSGGYNINMCVDADTDAPLLLLDYKDPNSIVIPAENIQPPSYYDNSDLDFSPKEIVNSIDFICGAQVGMGKIKNNDFIVVNGIGELPELKGCIKVNTNLEEEAVR